MEKTLVDIIKDHRSLDELLAESSGEVTDQSIESIVDSWMTEIKSDLAKKADGYEYRKKNIENAAANLKEKSEKLYQAAKQLDNVVAKLKERMKDAFRELETTVITGNDFRYILAETKPSVVISSETMLPAEYTREEIVIRPDKDKIKAALDVGIEIPGCMLRQNYSIRSYINKGKL